MHYCNNSNVICGIFVKVPETSGSKSKPLLSVKPSSQLLKPGAMTNLSTGAATKSSNQNNKSSPATGAAKQIAAVNVNKNTSKMSNIDARNKLALFKAQVLKLGAYDVIKF